MLPPAALGDSNEQLVQYLFQLSQLSGAQVPVKMHELLETMKNNSQISQQ